MANILCVIAYTALWPQFHAVVEQMSRHTSLSPLELEETLPSFLLRHTSILLFLLTTFLKQKGFQSR